MTRNEMRDWIGGCMKAKGFHDDGSGFADGGMVRASLVFTEIVEAMQEVKRHWKDPVPATIKDRIAEEMADTAIRLYDLAFKHDLMLDEAVGAIEKPRDLGHNDRHSLIIRCGKLISVVARAFDTFEDCRDVSDFSKSQEMDFFTGPDAMNEDVADAVLNALHHCESLCEKVGRDLSTAINAKMAENMARPHKYGTPDAASVAKADESVTPIGVGAELKRDQSAVVADIKRRLLAGESVTITVPVETGKACPHDEFSGYKPYSGPNLVPMCDGELTEGVTDGQRD